MAVKSDNILDHNMHSEYIELDQEVANRLNKYKSE
jgi:S-adenosylmethionine:tRNA-ribosyltransferase-isomerase (queuine synthetase)